MLVFAKADQTHRLFWGYFDAAGYLLARRRLESTVTNCQLSTTSYILRPIVIFTM